MGGGGRDWSAMVRGSFLLKDSLSHLLPRLTDTANNLEKRILKQGGS